VTNYFVTGASGFIGRHLVESLLAEASDGDQIAVLARDPDVLPIHWAPRIRVLKGSLLSFEPDTDLVQETQVVFHLAAKASISKGGDYGQDNVEGTRRLAELFESSAGLERFVFVSSIGAIDRFPQDPCTTPLDETFAANPLTSYGQSKLACEKLLQASPLPYTIIRPTWVYGPGMRADSHLRVFVDMVRRGSLIAGIDFPGRVSTIYVADLVSALSLAAHSPAALGQIYFAAAPDGHSLGELFSEIRDLAGRPPRVTKIPRWLSRLMQGMRPRLPFKIQNLFSSVLWADARRLNELGFQSSVDLRTGLLKTMHWIGQQSPTAGIPSGTAAVTGAASGIGRELALQWYANGGTVAPIDKDMTLQSYWADWPDAIPLVVDLAERDAREVLADRLIDIGIDCWINNAGIGLRGPFGDLSAARQQTLMAVNMDAVVQLSHAALKMFHAQGRGILVNVASSAAFQPLAGMAVYSASKSFVLQFTEALWIEQQQDPLIKIYAMVPSGTATQFQASAGVKNERPDQLLQPQYVAARMLRAMEGPSGTVMIGRSGKFMALFARLLSRRRLAMVWSRLMEHKR
jgi:hypothetical protein